MLRKVVKSAGWGLTLLAFYYVFQVFCRNADALARHAWGAWDAAAVLAAALVVGGAYFVLAVSWARMAPRHEERRLFWTVVAAYSITSIFKYLPGNCFHYVGRNVMGSQGEGEQVGLASATLFEVVLSGLCSVFVASLCALLPGANAGPAWRYALLLAAVLLGMAVLLRLSGMKARPGRGRLVSLALRLAEVPPGIAAPLGLTLLAYGLMAGAAVGVWNAFSAVPVAWPQIASAYVFSWLVGYVVPGAPGGLGVREAYLVLTLSPYATEPAAVLFALVMRVVVTLADLVLLAAGKVIQGRFPRRAAPLLQEARVRCGTGQEGGGV
ncbi:hypothetical protein [Desulfovibrio sp. X2]|uniref:hypothetical protein n=1 Tax=Desulfovibrio sp. X2 TaxID=941449 RepID=UPI00041672BE|nr:hypothetical protein [Desulfovibrio sp. X2]